MSPCVKKRSSGSLCPKSYHPPGWIPSWTVCLAWRSVLKTEKELNKRVACKIRLFSYSSYGKSKIKTTIQSRILSKVRIKVKQGLMFIHWVSLGKMFVPEYRSNHHNSQSNKLKVAIVVLTIRTHKPHGHVLHLSVRRWRTECMKVGDQLQSNR